MVRLMIITEHHKFFTVPISYDVGIFSYQALSKLNMSTVYHNCQYWSEAVPFYCQGKPELNILWPYGSYISGFRLAVIPGDFTYIAIVFPGTGL